MERAFENDNVFKNVVQEISRECSARCLEVEESLVQHVTKLMALDIDMGISSEGVVKRETLELFVNHVVNKFAIPEDECPQMTTLKMQLHGKDRCGPLEISLKSHSESLREYLYPLTLDIIHTDFEYCRTKKELLDKLRRKITVHVLLESQMGHPSHIEIFNEGYAALNSIISLEDLVEFYESDIETRINKLREFALIVAGIRLLNKRLKRCPGVGISDIPGELKIALAKSRTILNNALSELQEIIETLTSAVLYSTEIDYRRLLVNFKVRPDVLPLSEIEDIRDRLILQRQYEVLLNKLSNRLGQINENVENGLIKLESDLKIVATVVDKKNALRAALVFPLFCNVATAWFELQDQLYLLIESDQTVADLKAFATSLVIKNDVIQKMMGGNPIITMEDIAKNTPSRAVDHTDFKCKLLKYEEESVKEGYKLKFNGFCIWNLVHLRGCLVPAIPELGVLLHRSELYAFSTLEAIEAFGRTPDRYLYSALEVVRGKPELIDLFEIEQIIFTMSDRALNLCQELHPKPDRKEVRDVQIQTVTHLYEKKIDRNYKWNVWDMRREAIQMANLTKGKTTSMQTTRTYQKYAVCTQTTYPKNQFVQTRRENYTNTATPINYKLGLRGQKNIIRNTVDGTRPVGDDYYTCTAYNNILFDTPFPDDPVPKCAHDNNNRYCERRCRIPTNRSHDKK